MKKIFEYFGIISLVCFSFFLTDKASMVVQEVDDIMIQIKQHQEEYQFPAENVSIQDSYIIPGLPSKTVNIEESYQAMKKIGAYDPNYFVYDSKKPDDNLDDHLDKYIIKGNSKKRMASLIFIVHEDKLENLLTILGNYPASFVMQNYDFQNYSEELEQVILMGDEILIPESTEPDFVSMRQKLITYEQTPMTCYNETENPTFLSLCKSYGYHTITTGEVIDKKPLQTTKEKLLPGALLVYEGTPQLEKELSTIIAYIESRGYEITSLSNHLKED